MPNFAGTGNHKYQDAVRIPAITPKNKPNWSPFKIPPFLENLEKTNASQADKHPIDK
jgi:hypothetical protein